MGPFVKKHKIDGPILVHSINKISLMSSYSKQRKLTVKNVRLMVNTAINVILMVNTVNNVSLIGI
jgi:hypothetical protein